MGENRAHEDPEVGSEASQHGTEGVCWSVRSRGEGSTAEAEKVGRGQSMWGTVGWAEEMVQWEPQKHLWREVTCPNLHFQVLTLAAVWRGRLEGSGGK